jgi:hypothetical protein
MSRNGRQQVVRTFPFAAASAQPCEARGGPKFEGLRLLLTRDIERIAEAGPGLVRVAATARSKEFPPLLSLDFAGLSA